MANLPQEFQPKNFLDYVFEGWSILKIVDSILEVVSGAVLFFIKIKTITSIVSWLTAGELANDPDDLLANWLAQLAAQLSVSAKTFIAVYLLTHGIVKIVLLISMLRNKIWAYPAALTLLSGFIAFQTYKLTFKFSAGYAFLNIFDFLLLLLIGYEYWKIKKNKIPVTESND